MARAKDPMAFFYSLPKGVFEVQTYDYFGNGNQGVRIIHIPSGAIGECSEERRQPLNKRRAFERLTETHEYREWHMQQAILKLGRG